MTLFMTCAWLHMDSCSTAPGWVLTHPFLPTPPTLSPRAFPPLRHQLRGVADKELWQHDFIRALRMASYGFLLYGPGSYVWYQRLDRLLPAPTLTNFVLKVGSYVWYQRLDRLLPDPTLTNFVLKVGGGCTRHKQRTMAAYNAVWIATVPRPQQPRVVSVLTWAHRMLQPPSPLGFPPSIRPGDSESSGAAAVCAAAGGIRMEHGVDGQGQGHFFPTRPSPLVPIHPQFLLLPLSLHPPPHTITQAPIPFVLPPPPPPQHIPR
ncbi:unnamed protein product [Closterium sp. NIES-53]